MKMFKLLTVVLIVVISKQTLAFGRNDKPLETQAIKVLSYDLWNNGPGLESKQEKLEDALEKKESKSLPEELNVPLSQYFGQQQN